MAAPLISAKYAVTKVPIGSDGTQQLAKYIDYNFFAQHGMTNLSEVHYLDAMRNSDIPSLRKSMYNRDNTIMALFDKNKKVVDTDSAERLRWNMELPNTDLRATFVKNVEVGNLKAGIRNTPFDVILSSNNYGINDIFIFDGYRDMPIVLRSEPFPEGVGYRYECVLLTDDPNDFIELHRIPVGTRLSQSGSLIGEATIHRGNINLATGSACIEFESQMTRMGWRMKVTDKAQMKMESAKAMDNYAFYDPSQVRKGANGSMQFQPLLLTNRLEQEFLAIINEQVDLYLTYGKQTTKTSQITDTITGSILQTGSGFYEFLNTSYIHEYIPFVDGIDVVIDQIAPLWNNKVPINERKIVLMSGSGGFQVWEKWANENNLTKHYEDDSWTKDKIAGLTPDRVGVAVNKQQILKVFLAPFGWIEFVYAAWMDNDKNGGKKLNSFPASSYEFIVIDYGFGDGIDSNIYIAEDKKTEQLYYGTGGWTPHGSVTRIGTGKGKYVPTLGSENAYEIVCERSIGFVMKDPSKMMRFLPVI
jgi:hypothetical protein